MNYHSEATLPSQWKPLLDIPLLHHTLPRRPTVRDDREREAWLRQAEPYRGDMRTIVVNFAGAADCVLAEVRLVSVNTNYYLEAVLFDDGHDVDCVGFDPGDAEVVLSQGEDTYTIRLAVESPG